MTQTDTSKKKIRVRYSGKEKYIALSEDARGMLAVTQVFWPPDTPVTIAGREFRIDQIDLDPPPEPPKPQVQNNMF